MGPAEPIEATAQLPHWRRALAVVAHPDDESFALGAVLSTLVDAGTPVSVLCFTHGEASTLHGVAGDLVSVREAELAAAGEELGLASVRLLDYPDGGLGGVELDALVSEVRDAALADGIDGLVVFDPTGVTGHPDHQQATEAAIVAGRELGLDVLGWTIPTEVAQTLRAEHGVPFAGHRADEIDVVIEVDRTAQRRAVDCHPSQAVPGSALWSRLDLLADREHLRWLSRAGRPAS